MTRVVNSAERRSVEQEAILTPEGARVAAFQETLGRVAVVKLESEMDITAPDVTEAAKRYFMGNFYQSEPTFYAVPEASVDLEQSLVGFEPLRSSHGLASGHGVFFGALLFDDGSELPVAVKPHATNEDDTVTKREAESSCLNDYYKNVIARRCGFESLMPVGFVLDEGGTPYSLTVLDGTLDTFDGINWSRFYEADYETDGMRELLHKAAIMAGTVHSVGNSFHGDFAARNIATNVHGQVFAIDWEYGDISRSPEGDIEERFGRSWKDLKTLLQSLMRPNIGEQPGVGLFNELEGDWWPGFKDVFFDDYVATRMHFAEQGSHHMKRLQDVEQEVTQLEYVLEQEVQKWQPRYQEAINRPS